MSLYLLSVQLRPHCDNPVVPPLRINFEPRLPFPRPLVHVIKHEFQPIIPACTLDPEAQIIHPEAQLGFVETRLGVHLFGVLLLRCESLVDEFLR